MINSQERKSEKRNFTEREQISRVSGKGDIVTINRTRKNMKKNIAEYIKVFDLIMNNPSEKVDTVYKGTVSYIYNRLKKIFTAPMEQENIQRLIRKKINELFSAKIRNELNSSFSSVKKDGSRVPINNENKRQFMAAHFYEQFEQDTCYVCNQQLMRGKCSPHVEHIIRILPLYLLMGHIQYENNSIHQLAIKESHRLCNLMKSTVSLLEYKIESDGKIMAELREDTISELSTGIHNASKSVGPREISDKYDFRETEERKQPIIKEKVSLPWKTTYIQTNVGQKVNSKNASEYEIIKKVANPEDIYSNLTKEIMALKEAINKNNSINIYHFYDNLNMLVEEIKDQFAVKGGKTKKAKGSRRRNKTRSKRT